MKLPLSLGYRTADLTVGRVLRRQARELGGKTFLHYLPDGRRWSFAEADEQSDRLASGLLGLGVRHGTHVALLLENCPEFILLCLALGKLGAVAVPINTAAKGELLRYYLAQSDSTMIVVDDELRERVPDMLKVIPLSALPHAGGDLPQDSVAHGDLAIISYTSGTTGPSKGNMMSQAAALAVGLSNAECHGYTRDDVLYACLPLFHMNALQATTYAALVTGCTLALSRRFSASNYWNEAGTSGATVTGMLGSMAHFLWQQPPSPADREHKMRLAICVPIPEFGAGFEQRFGLRLASSYGISDYALVTAYTLADPPDKLGSAGRPRPGFVVRVVDDGGRDQPPGTSGEILVRSGDTNRVASGYYKMPKETAGARRQGWFHTGDQGYLDAEGYLWFSGRKKDAIRRRGENISAFEVEKIINTHPAVAESAVFALPGESAEDEVAAAVLLKPGAKLTEAELIEHCKANMAYYMVPRYLAFRTELPRTVNQKIEKYRLRDEFARDLGRLWDREKAGIEVRRDS